MSAKKAIVISIDPNIEEIEDLIKSLDYEVIDSFIQNKDYPDVNYYVGSGKVEEIDDFIKNSEEKIDLAVVNGKLKPSQWFNLEKKFKIDVFDRITLILNIFERRADRKEARLQVRLAQIQYERSFVRELIHRARAGEHPGFMAGGEYQVDDYYENLKKQIKKIKKNLDTIRQSRSIRRKNRHSGGFYLVSLCGYTNAGKSSLLNILSKGEVKVEDKLFSTLSTTTRKITNSGLPILVTDTVGFIEDLPSLIVDAFHSTLEEIKLADFVILVVDFSEDLETIKDKLKISLKELTDLGVESPIIIAFNKIDLLDSSKVQNKFEEIRSLSICKDKKMALISAKNQQNIDDLIDVVYSTLPKLKKYTIKLPINNQSQSLVSKIHNKANVIDISYGNYIKLSFEGNSVVADKFIDEVIKLNGFVLD